jgi:hypothetical protein
MGTRLRVYDINLYTADGASRFSVVGKNVDDVAFYSRTRVFGDIVSVLAERVFSM